MKILEPNQLIVAVKKKIKPEWKVAFISSIILGIIIHLYIIVNNFPNHDGLYSIYSSQNNIYNGRWFLMSACSISSFFALPWVSGLLSIIYLSITSVILVELFKIKKNLHIILISGILVSFPTIAASFSYLFMMDGFMLALLLSSLSVLLTYKYKYGFVAGAICLSLSVGIYQSYLSFALLLCFFKILFSILDKTNKKELIYEIVKDIIFLIVGIVLYYISLKVLLKIENIQLASYQGISSLGSFSFNNLLQGIYLAYIEFAKFITKTSFLKSNVLIVFCNILVIIFAIYIFIKTYIKNKAYTSFFNNIITFILILLIPIATNIIKLISVNTYYHLLMQYHWCLFYIALIILIEKYLANNIDKWICTISLFIIIFYFYIVTNIAYFNVEYKFEKTYSFGLRLVDRIEQCEEYSPAMHIAILGTPSQEFYPSTNLTNKITNSITGTQGDIIFFEPYHYESFFENYFNFSVEYASQDEINKVIESNEYNEMPFWPNKNSIKVINNILVINLSEINVLGE